MNDNLLNLQEDLVVADESEFITNSMIKNRATTGKIFDLEDGLVFQEFQSFIYVISGFQKQPLNSIEKYDLQNGIWKEFPDSLKVPRTKFQAVPISDPNN